MENQTKEQKQLQDGKNWFDRYYKILMLIPIIMVIISLVYLFNFYGQTGDFINRDVSLKGGTTITLPGIEDSSAIEKSLQEKVTDISFRSLSDLRTGKKIALIIESGQEPEVLKKAVEDVLGYNLTEDNSSIVFTGSTLSANFYKQLIIALIISFVLMSCVIFIMFRTFIPSIAVIFAAFSNIVIALTVIDYLGIKISAAGIAAFLIEVVEPDRDQFENEGSAGGSQDIDDVDTGVHQVPIRSRRAGGVGHLEHIGAAAVQGKCSRGQFSHAAASGQGTARIDDHGTDRSTAAQYAPRNHD